MSQHSLSPATQFPYATHVVQVRLPFITCCMHNPCQPHVMSPCLAEMLNRPGKILNWFEPWTVNRTCYGVPEALVAA